MNFICQCCFMWDPQGIESQLKSSEVKCNMGLSVFLAALCKYFIEVLCSISQGLAIK